MRLAGYVRVSSGIQADYFGKSVQMDAQRAWAAHNGHEIVKWYEEDGVSGKTDGGERPALLSAIEEADALDVEGVLFFDQSRIARRTVVQETVLAMIWKAGLRTFTTTADELADDDDPTRILIRQILAVVAEFDHRTTVKRLRAAKMAKREQGGYIGGAVKFGTTLVGSGRTAEIIPNEGEQRTMLSVRRWRRDGYSLQDIADRLNEERVPTKTGKGKWHASQVSRMLDPTH